MSNKMLGKMSTYQRACNIFPSEDIQFVPGKLRIGECNQNIIIEKRAGQKNIHLCRDVIEHIWSGGESKQLQLTFRTERNTLTTHIRRRRHHSDYWLDIFASYTDEQFMQEFGCDQFHAYKEHVKQYGKAFRWNPPKLTFEQREEKFKQQYLPADIMLDYPQLEILTYLE